MSTIKAIAGKAVSVGVAVRSVGHKSVYAGNLFKPWTWLRWERLPVIEPIRVDHLAVIGEIIDP